MKMHRPFSTTASTDTAGTASTASTARSLRTQGSCESLGKGRRYDLTAPRQSRIERDVADQAAIPRGVTDKATRQQVLLTSCGAALIVLSFLIGVTTYWVTQLRTSEALVEEGKHIRKNVGKTVMKEVVRTLQPVYSTTRRLTEQAKVGVATGSKIWPPTRATFEDKYEELAANLWVQLESDLHMRRVSADGSSRERLPILAVWAHIALKEDLRTFARSMEECAHVLHLAVYVIEGVQQGNIVFSESPRKLITNTVIRADENGTEYTRTQMQLFDASTKAALPDVIAEYAGSGCDQMIPLWGDTPIQESFENFSWHGPDRDIYKAITGNAPFYSPDGHQIGFFGSKISVVWSVNPVLAKIIEDGGDFTRGAELAIVSESGLLLGTSEFDTDSSKAYNYIGDLPDDSVLRKATGLIEEKAGSTCPTTYASIDEGDRLVDATPFYTQDYGMPPMNERWCVIQTFPRDNIYEAIDTARVTRIVGASVNFVLFFFAIVLFLVSLFLALRSDRGLRKEKVMADLRQVLAAVRDVHALNSPMVLVSATTFLELDMLESYESLRDRGLITVLDSLEAVMKFKRRSMILFLSHQWLSLDFPDSADGIQLAAMKGAVRTVLSEPLRIKDVHIWCDFTSIAQHHTRMQRAAINSLPVYASMADKFIVIAPTAVHEDLRCECNLATYNERGWCRAEMLAKACGSGIDDVYTCTDALGTLSPVTVEDLSQLSLNIFEGKFTVPEDVEDLVQPALGLYSLVLRNRDLPHMQLIHSHIQEDKDKFFPKSYVSSKHGDRVELFGKRVSLLESYIANCNAIANGDVVAWERLIS